VRLSDSLVTDNIVFQVEQDRQEPSKAGDLGSIQSNGMNMSDFV
jgi:hypothetical protein